MLTYSLKFNIYILLKFNFDMLLVVQLFGVLKNL